MAKTKKSSKKVSDSTNQEEVMTNVNENAGEEIQINESEVGDLPAEVIAQPKTKKASAPRASKVYKIAIGTKPENNKKVLGVHAEVITEAITALVNEGKTEASRDEIMGKAVELGLYDKKPSVQGVIPIFSWWRKPLAGLGWLSQNEVEAKAAPTAEEKIEELDKSEGDLGNQ